MDTTPFSGPGASSATSFAGQAAQSSQGDTLQPPTASFCPTNSNQSQFAPPLGNMQAGTSASMADASERVPAAASWGPSSGPTASFSRSPTTFATYGPTTFAPNLPTTFMPGGCGYGRTDPFGSLAGQGSQGYGRGSQGVPGGWLGLRSDGNGGDLRSTAPTLSTNPSVPIAGQATNAPGVQTGPAATSSSSPPIRTAAEASATLHAANEQASSNKIDSAFQVLDIRPPPHTGRQGQDQAERFIAALTGEKRSIPSWSGQPNSLRTWLKLLAHWESETTVPREKWGIRLYQSFPENSEPRKIADQVTLETVLGPDGYGQILSVIMAKYKPFLDVAGPTAVDKFFYAGERQKGQSFATYIAQKETAKEELEGHLQERLNEKVAGRILLRHAQLTEFQREMIALRDMNNLMSFAQVASLLRPLDRPDLIAQAANAELGSQAAKHYPVMTQDDEHDDLEDDDDPDEDWTESEESEEDAIDEMTFEDREYDEDEATYIQAYHSAYADVRRDLQNRRKERGFVRHARSDRPRQGKGKGRGRKPSLRDRERRPSGKGLGGPRMMRGSAADLQTRTRCFNCKELGHFARDCPLKGAGRGTSASKPSTAAPKNVSFVVCRGGAATSTTFMTVLGRPTTATTTRSLHIYAGVQVQATEALVDTAAEDAVVGTTALSAIKQALARWGLQIQVVENSPLPCAGIGGAAKTVQVVDIPTSVAGILGLVRFTVLQDDKGFHTPPLLPISYLEAIRAIIDLSTEEVRTPNGLSTPMRRLPSGHRSIGIMDFDAAPWQLPFSLQQHYGRDPFLLDANHNLESKGVELLTSTSTFATSGELASSATKSPSALDTSSATKSPSALDTSSATKSFAALGTSESTAKGSHRATVATSNESSRERLEEVAHGKLVEGKFSHQDMEEVLRCCPTKWKSKTRSSMSSGSTRSGHVTLGLYAYGSMQGITRDSKEYPFFCKFVNQWIRQHSKEAFSWTSVAINFQSSMSVHKDVNNLQQSENMSASFGSFSKGELWIALDNHEPGECDQIVWQKRGEVRMPGKLVRTFHNPHYFDASLHHCTMPWKGYRMSVNAYTARTVQSLRVSEKNDLQELGFRLRPGEVAQMHWLSELGEETSGEDTCGHDFETVFEKFESKALSDDAVSRFKRMIARAAIWIANSARPASSIQHGQRQGTGGEDGSGGSGGLRHGEQAGHQEGHGGLEAVGHSTHADVDDGPQAAGYRPSDSASRPPRGGAREHHASNKGESKEEGGPNSSRTGQPAGEFAGTQEVSDRHAQVQPPSRCASLSGQSTGQVVDMHEMWSSLGPTRRNAGDVLNDDNPGGGERRCGQDSTQGQGVPIVPSSAQREAGARPQARGGDSDRKAHHREVRPIEASDATEGLHDLDNTHWSQIFFGNGVNHENFEPNQEAVADWSAPNAKGQDTNGSEESRDVRALRGRLGMVGRGYGVGRGEGQPQTKDRRRVLVSGVEIEKCQQAKAVKLATKLKDAGWVMKAIMVMITMAAWSGGPENEWLGKPVWAARWSGHTQQWRTMASSENPSNVQASSEIQSNAQASAEIQSNAQASAEIQSNAQASAEIQSNAQVQGAGQCSDQDSVESDYTPWCYVFPVQQVSADRLGDNCGIFKSLDKNETKHIMHTIQGKWDVCEVFSPPRVTKRAQRLGIKPGMAMDLATGWDFAKSRHREEALRLINEHQPALVMLSPPCGPFSSMRNLTNHKRDSHTVAAEVKAGRKHLAFAARIARLQMAAGRGFLFEHPASAVSWRERTLEELRQHAQVYEVRLDMCQFGLVSATGNPTLKPTLLLTNIQELAKCLAKRCERLHVHEPLEGGQATRRAAIYTDAFVDAILRGLRQHLQLQHYPVFGLEDKWLRTAMLLQCVHFNPRQALCQPAECPHVAWQSLAFTGKRVTQQLFVSGGAKKLVDDWRHGASVPSSLWTGTTTFEIQPEVILPQSFVDVAKRLTKHAAHDLYHYQYEHMQFQTEWLLIHHAHFPSHRILEERETVSNRQDEDSDHDVDMPLRSNDDDELEDAMEYEPDYEVDEDEKVVEKELRDMDVPKASNAEGRVVLAPDVRREVYRIHRNLGHPNLQTFLRALRHAGVKAEILRWVKSDCRCPICETKRKPASQRPAHLSRSLEFNEVVGVDIFFIKKRPLLNVLCWGTSLQLVELLTNKSSEEVTRVFFKSWISHYGVPHMVVADQGTEFTGTPFVNIVSDAGALVHFTDVRAPWQNARTERAGGLFKAKLEVVLAEATVINDWEYEVAISETLWSRNSYYDRSGYTPHQRVFGISPRIPANMLSDDAIDRELLKHPQTDAMRFRGCVKSCESKHPERRHPADQCGRLGIRLAQSR